MLKKRVSLQEFVDPLRLFPWVLAKMAVLVFYTPMKKEEPDLKGGVSDSLKNRRLRRELPSSGGTVIPATGEFLDRNAIESRLETFRLRLKDLKEQREVSRMK